MSWWDIIKIKFDRKIAPKGAIYSPSDDVIYLGPNFDFDSALESIIHEETHRAQLNTATQGDFEAEVTLTELNEKIKEYVEDKNNIEELIKLAEFWKDNYLKTWLELSFVIEIQAYMSDPKNRPVGLGPKNSTLDRLEGLNELFPDGLAITNVTDLEYDYNDIIDDMIYEGTQIIDELEERRKRMTKSK